MHTRLAPRHPLAGSTVGLMSTPDDRRRYDPFAPHVLVGAVAPPVQDAADDESTEPDLDAMSKAELIALAKEHELATYGSRADIVDRLRA